LSVSVFSLPGENKLLASIGKDSLIYYLYHSIIIAVLIPPIASVLHLSDFNMAISLLLVLLVMLIVAGINKLRVFRFLANPLR
jgi:fucose 4-O-acetylase-like acetyltransferase